MPIEIRELVIRATVEPPPAAPAASAGAAPAQDLEDIVSMCVEQVLDVLRRERER